MSTPNLAIAHIASNAASKEVVANAAFDELSAALTNLLTHAMTDADYTLQDNPPVSSEARYNMVYRFTGALTATRNVVVPNAEKLYIFSNQTTGGHALTIKTLAGTGITVLPDSTYWLLYCDGTNVIKIGPTSDSQLSIAMPDANYTVTAAQLMNASVLVFTGTLTADRDIIVPAAIQRNFTVANHTDGGWALTVKTSGGTGVRINSAFSNGLGDPFVASYIPLFNDGTNTVLLSPAKTFEYDFWIKGLPSNGQLIIKVMSGPAARVFDASNFLEFWAQVPPTGTPLFAFDLSFNNGATWVNWINAQFAAGDHFASTYNLLANWVAGDGTLLRITCPSPQDATLADIWINITGYQQGTV